MFGFLVVLYSFSLTGNLVVLSWHRSCTGAACGQHVSEEQQADYPRYNKQDMTSLDITWSEFPIVL